MSLLQNIVTKVITNAMNGNQQPRQSQPHNDLGGLLGSVIGGQMGGNQANAGLGGLLGSVLGGQDQRRNASPADLGGVLGQVLGNQSPQRQGGFNKSSLLLVLVPIVLAYIQKNGGLSGVLSKFNNSGLGNKAQSWVNIDRDNDGIDAGDIMRLFGQDEIDSISRQTGASQTEVAQGIAELLPEVVNDLTPHGDVDADEQEANDEISQILAQLQAAR